jgi:glucose/arabinose dehydrogenase
LPGTLRRYRYTIAFILLALIITLLVGFKVPSRLQRIIVLARRQVLGIPYLVLESSLRQSSPLVITARDGRTPSIPLNIALVLVTNDLDNPTGVTNSGDGSGDLFIIEKAGTVERLLPGMSVPSRFLDISDRVDSSNLEQGLLGIAFPPDYAQRGYFFLNYTDLEGDTVIARIRASPDRHRADPGSEEIVLKIAQPDVMHNGGQLAFGPDGFLYIGVGDGGGEFDYYRNAQNARSMLGTILRIDVAHLPYSIPSDNPFVKNPAGRKEIWLMGLRNPWRFSFDAATGDLYIGDVGQMEYEEILRHPAGAGGGQNYGWPIKEGSVCTGFAPCLIQGLEPPWVIYHHTLGCAVTGGSVYRGTQIPDLIGAYVFADYCTGRIWAYRDGIAESRDVPMLESGFAGLSSFGVDEAGEMYVASLPQGRLLAIRPSDHLPSNSP